MSDRVRIEVTDSEKKFRQHSNQARKVGVNFDYFMPDIRAQQIVTIATHCIATLAGWADNWNRHAPVKTTEIHQSLHLLFSLDLDAAAKFLSESETSILILSEPVAQKKSEIGQSSDQFNCLEIHSATEVFYTFKTSIDPYSTPVKTLASRGSEYGLVDSTALLDMS